MTLYKLLNCSDARIKQLKDTVFVFSNYGYITLRVLVIMFYYLDEGARLK